MTPTPHTPALTEGELQELERIRERRGDWRSDCLFKATVIDLADKLLAAARRGMEGEAHPDIPHMLWDAIALLNIWIAHRAFKEDEDNDEHAPAIRDKLMQCLEVVMYDFEPAPPSQRAEGGAAAVPHTLPPPSDNNY